jgi:hypothetical protein
MHNLKHPIAVFVLAVLAVIGVGVGVVAATTRQRVYGPSWGRFSAAFAGRVYEHQGHPSVTIGGGSGDSSALSTIATLALPTYSYSNQQHGDWVAYAPRSDTFYPSFLQSVSVVAAVPLTGNGSLQQVVHAVKTVFFRAGVPESAQNTNGLSVTTIGPQCNGGMCIGARVVSNGQVVWDLLAISQMGDTKPQRASSKAASPRSPWLAIRVAEGADDELHVVTEAAIKLRSGHGGPRG